jgi:putative membrane protein
MKLLVFRGVAVMALTFAVSTTGLPQSTQTNKHDRHQKDQMKNQAQAMIPSDNTFLKNALEANTAEIEFGKIAQNKTQNPEVREFANMLVQDHSQAIERIRNTMNNGTNDQTSGQVQLSPEHQQTVTKLSKLSGAAFDREFINVVVQDHRKDVRMFEQKAGATTDTANDAGIVREKPADDLSTTEPGDVTAGAANAQSLAKDLLPTLRNHLNHAEQLQRTIKK